MHGGAVVLGCSIGSKIALMLACDHPEIFKAAILVGGNSGPQPAVRSSHRRLPGASGGRRTRRLSLGPPALWRHVALGRQRDRALLVGGLCGARPCADAESIAQVFQALAVSDLTPKLPHYRSPTLIVNGEHDTHLPVELELRP